MAPTNVGVVGRIVLCAIRRERQELRLVITFDQDGSPWDDTVYEGSSVPDMGLAIEDYITSHTFTSLYRKHVRRWWTMYGEGYANDGLEPEFRLLGNVGVDSWKIWQTPIGS